MNLYQYLEGARSTCERRMAELGEGKVGGEIPREWFALDSMERRLRPLVHEAARIEGLGPVVFTKIASDGTVVDGS